MIHHGKKLEEIAKQRGLNKTQIAKKLGKSSQAVDYDFKKASVNVEILTKYASLFNLPLEYLQSDQVNSNQIEIENKSINFVTVEKMLELMEENRKLWSVIARHGIAVNFNLVSSYATALG